MTSNEITIREMHSNNKMGFVKSCFYIALAESKTVSLDHDAGCIDRRIAFTIDGQEIDFIPVLDRFQRKLESYIKKEARRFYDRNFELFKKFVDEKMENIEIEYRELMDVLEYESESLKD